MFIKSFFCLIFLLQLTIMNHVSQQESSERNNDKKQQHKLNSSEVVTQINTQNIEIEAKKDEQHQIEILDEWVKAQMHHNSDQTITDTYDGENFIFKILNGHNRRFVIPSSGTTSLDLLIRVFEVNNNQILLPKNPSKQSRIIFTVLGKQSYSNTIYLVRKIKISEKEKQYQILLQNRYPNDMIVQIRLQKQFSIVDKIVNSTKIDPLTAKMKYVLQQIQAGISQKRLIFKSQLGYMQQNQKQHASMLTLTGIQLLTLLVSVFVQMYYLKNLIQNRSLV